MQRTSVSVRNLLLHSNPFRFVLGDNITAKRDGPGTPNCYGTQFVFLFYFWIPALAEKCAGFLQWADFCLKGGAPLSRVLIFFLINSRSRLFDAQLVNLVRWWITGKGRFLWIDCFPVCGIQITCWICSAAVGEITRVCVCVCVCVCHSSLEIINCEYMWWINTTCRL